MHSKSAFVLPQNSPNPDKYTFLIDYGCIQNHLIGWSFYFFIEQLMFAFSLAFTMQIGIAAYPIGYVGPFYYLRFYRRKAYIEIVRQSDPKSWCNRPYEKCHKFRLPWHTILSLTRFFLHKNLKQGEA